MICVPVAGLLTHPRLEHVAGVLGLGTGRPVGMLSSNQSHRGVICHVHQIHRIGSMLIILRTVLESICIPVDHNLSTVGMFR